MAENRNMGMSLGLMRTRCVTTMMQWGGDRLRLTAPAYIHGLRADDVRRDDPLFISTLCGLSVPSGLGNTVERTAKIVAQACAVGYEEAVLPDLPASRVIVAKCIVEKWPRLPTELKDQIENLPEWLPGRAEAGRAAREAVEATEETATYRAINPIIDVLKNADAQKGTTIRHYTTGLIAYCKQGTASINVINKIQTGVQESLGMVINLDQGVIRLVWNMVKSWMTPAKAAHFFGMWETAVGEHCLRLRLLINQASWVGMTNFQNIMTAKSTFPDFSWAVLAAYIPDEMARFHEAFRAVNGDPYYGYRHDLGHAKATNYPNLAYCAYCLLTEIKGDRSLNQFMGINRNCDRAPEITTLINNYRNARVAAAQNVAQDPGRDAREAAAAFAALAINPPIQE